MVDPVAFAAVECLRCGQCCEGCPRLGFLVDGRAHCERYEARSAVCRAFPQEYWALLADADRHLPGCAWHPDRLVERGIVRLE